MVWQGGGDDGEVRKPRLETEKLGQKTKVRKQEAEGQIQKIKIEAGKGKSEVRKQKSKFRKPDLELENKNPDFHFIIRSGHCETTRPIDKL